MKKSYMMAVCAALLTACTTKDEVMPPTSQDVSFYPTMTRATETQFEEGDVISVSAVQPSAGTELKASGNYADNVHYVYRGGKFEFVPETGKTKIKLPGDDAGLAYYAVYPQQYVLSTRGTFAVQRDQRLHADRTTSDFCTVYKPASNEQDVYLKFWHRLSRICVNIQGVPSGQQVTMRLKNMLYEAAFDLNAHTYTGTGTSRAYIEMGEMSTNRDFEAILPPQAFNLATDIIVTVGGVDHNVTTSRPADTFRSGMQYDYRLIYDGGDITPDEMVFEGYIHPWNTSEIGEVVGGDETADNLRDKMPIYDGSTPPNVEGCYFIDPFETVYCEDQGNGGFDPGTIVNSYYCRFMNQNASNNTIDFEGKSISSTQRDQGIGAYIRGSGNNFTAFFNTTGESQGISTKTALLISGTKTSEGIKDIYYGFVMVDKGEDPNNKLMKKGIFRVFHDQDGLAVNSTWPEEVIIVAEESRSAAKGLESPWTIYSRKE